MVAEPKRLDELALAVKAEKGDSDCAAELRNRILRCAVSVARKMRWNEALDANELEDDVPNEALLRLLGRIRNGFSGEPVQFRTYLYRVVVSVAADFVRRNLDRRRELSLDVPFENADGQTTALRDFVESTAGLAGEQSESDNPLRVSLDAERRQRLTDAVLGLDDWCQTLVQDAIVDERPHADIARDKGVSVVMVDVSLKRCTERLYRNILMAYVSSPERARRGEVAEVARRLPEDLKAVFLPWWNDRISVKQIAADLGMSNDAAKRTLARAKATMWHLMEEP